MRVLGAKLLGSWPNAEAIPNFGFPELALIGRSNVGKSTLVNSLVGRKSLARVSATPGKTQEAVCFEVDIETEPKVRKKALLVDLPGFGFAKVSKDKRKDFHKLIVEYIKKRPSLNAICLLNDCRRQPGDDELVIWDVAKAKNCLCNLVITKVDKLGTNAKNQAIAQISKFYPEIDKIVVSGSNIPREKIQSDVFELLLAQQV